MKRLLFLGFLLGGCATTSSYTGPEQEVPFVRVEVRRTPGFTSWGMLSWRSQPVAVVVNPTRRHVTFSLLCDRGEWLDEQIRGREEKSFLLDSADASCRLEWRAAL